MERTAQTTKAADRPGREASGATFSPRPPLRAHRGGRPLAGVEAVREPARLSPVLVVEAALTTSLVAGMVAGMVAVAVTASAPLLAAGLLLGRMARTSDRT